MDTTNRALTKQQQMFVDAYLSNPGMTATDCIRIAYPKTKYPDRMASQLLENTRVRKAISDVRQKVAEKVNIDAEWVLKKYIGIIERCEETEPQTARAALDSVGKHLGMFKDKVEMTGADGGALKVMFNIPRPGG